MQSEVVNIPSEVTHHCRPHSLGPATHPRIKVASVIHTTLLSDRIVECFHHSSNAKIIISLLFLLLCNNMYSGVEAPVVKQMLDFAS